MSNETTSVQVLVYPTNGEAAKGLLKYKRNGPEIELEDGTTFQGESIISFRILKHTSKNSDLTKIGPINIKPVLVTEMGYSVHPIGTDMMYPPSTNSWILHVADGEQIAVFTIQSLLHNDRYLLTISDIQTGALIDALLIHKYEVSLLSMKRDLEIYRDIFQSKSARPELHALLESKSPSWPFIASLVEDVTIPNLSLKESFGETLEQLVPVSFPSRVRTQVLAFLAWLNSAEIPKEDPIDFRSEFSSVDVFQFLVEGHLLCMIDDVPPPSYVRIMVMADKGLLESTDRPIPEIELRNPWVRAEMRIQELFPDMMKHVIDYTRELNNQGKILTCLPITRKEAAKSKLLWSKRLVLSRMGLFMRGYVQRKALGLKTAVYFGNAHKWPHKHLELSARLGFQSSKPPQVQIMVMPPTAIERVSRILEKIHVIDWEMSSLNFDLYTSSKRKWSMNSSTILKSLERKRSLRQLQGEFGGWGTSTPIKIDPKQAKILDLLSWGLYLTSLEANQYSRLFEIDNETLENELTHLKELGVFSLQFSSILQKLTSICILAEGSSTSVCSLSRSFLKHAPSADVRLTRDGTTSLIMSRVPEDDAYSLLTALPKAALENDVHLRALPISAYIGYRHNLYQRLLQTDGSWDDDISGLISQSRLRSKNDN